MLVLKKLFSGNYLKKLLLLKNNSKEINQDSNITSNEQNIIEKNEIITEESINNNNSNNQLFLISIYESSLDITQCEYDQIIKQYIQTPIFHQNFFFIIFDSEIIDTKIILLTSIGLFIYEYSENKLNLLFHEIFNIKCEPKDLLMYLKVNQKLNIIGVYSNTNLFFLYYYDTKLNTCHKVNQINKLANGYINHLNIFDLEHTTDYFIVSIQIKLLKKFLSDNYVYFFNKEKNEINQINIKELKDDNNVESNINKNIKYINDIFAKINESYSDEKINEIRFSLYGKYIFIINQNGFIILKNKKNENDENIIDLMIKFKFKYGPNLKHSCFIDYQRIKNYHFLFFDNKISLFEEKNDILSRIKLTPKINKKFLTNSNAIFQNLNPDKEIQLILYNYKNDISFITIKKEEQEEESLTLNKYKIDLITKVTNESMFCLDGVITQNNKDEYKIIALCGLQGESRLIKYSNIINEIVLFNQQIDLQIISICFPLYNFKQNYFSNIFITSSDIKSNLYSLSNHFKINHLFEFASPALKIYPLLNNNSYIIVLKYGVGLIIFNDSNIMNQFDMKQLYESKKSEDSSNMVQILFSYYFLFKGKEYLVLYLNNTHMICFDINSSNTLFDVELNELSQISALGAIAIERLNMIGFMFGNYLNHQIMIIYYDMEKNCFDKEKISKTEIKDSSGSSLLTPDDILIYKYFIFITTHTGDFILFQFNDNDLVNPFKIIFNLENITKNKSSLKFSQIDFFQENNEFNIDFYSFKNGYNIKLIINNNDKIACNIINQLTKYKFNQKIESSLVNFQKIYSDSKNTKIHFYFKKNCLNFSYFQEQIYNNNLSIETMYNFHTNEKAIKILPITDHNGEILILTNNLKLYLFNEDLNLILIKNIEEDVKKPELKIIGMKNYVIKEDDEQEKADINIIILFGGFKNEVNKIIGILIIYQYIDMNLKPIKVITGFPKLVNDACFIKKYIICGIEAALCVREYNVRNNQFIWNQDAKSIIISNYMNKITNLVPLNNFCDNYYLLTCDTYESFQLIKFSGVSPDKYETLGADLSLNSLGNIYPINNSYEEIFTTDKKGILRKLNLKDDLYQINNKVDLKEFITKLYVNNNKVIMIGILGSIYYGEITDKNDFIKNKDYEKQLLQFQKDIFNEVCNINLKKNLEYEEAMLMNEKINNILLIDTLLYFCEKYINELKNKINDFDNLVNALKIINDNNLIFKNQ